MSTTSNKIMAVNPDAIPLELRALPNWVCWREEQRDGRPTKVPYCILTGRRASAADPATWTDFDTAVAALPHYDGLGFNIIPPFTPVDLDGCRDPKTSAITPWGTEMLRLLNSWTEITPSQMGLHVWIKGVIPGERRKASGDPKGTKIGFEVYDHGRYFTITGCHLEKTPATIEERDHGCLCIWILFQRNQVRRPVARRMAEVGLSVAVRGGSRILQNAGAEVWQGSGEDGQSISRVPSLPPQVG